MQIRCDGSVDINLHFSADYFILVGQSLPVMGPVAGPVV